MVTIEEARQQLEQAKQQLALQRQSIIATSLPRRPISVLLKQTPASQVRYKGVERPILKEQLESKKKLALQDIEKVEKEVLEPYEKELTIAEQKQAEKIRKEVERERTRQMDYERKQQAYLDYIKSQEKTAGTAFAGKGQTVVVSEYDVGGTGAPVKTEIFYEGGKVTKPLLPETFEMPVIPEFRESIQVAEIKPTFLSVPTDTALVEAKPYNIRETLSGIGGAISRAGEKFKGKLFNENIIYPAEEKRFRDITVPVFTSTGFKGVKPIEVPGFISTTPIAMPYINIPGTDLLEYKPSGERIGGKYAGFELTTLGEVKRTIAATPTVMPYVNIPKVKYLRYAPEEKAFGGKYAGFEMTTVGKVAGTVAGASSLIMQKGFSILPKVLSGKEALEQTKTAELGMWNIKQEDRGAGVFRTGTVQTFEEKPISFIPIEEMPEKLSLVGRKYFESAMTGQLQSDVRNIYNEAIGYYEPVYKEKMDNIAKSYQEKVDSGDLSYDDAVKMLEQDAESLNEKYVKDVESRALPKVEDAGTGYEKKIVEMINRQAFQQAKQNLPATILTGFATGFAGRILPLVGGVTTFLGVSAGIKEAPSAFNILKSGDKYTRGALGLNVGGFVLGAAAGSFAASTIKVRQKQTAMKEAVSTAETKLKIIEEGNTVGKVKSMKLNAAGKEFLIKNIKDKGYGYKIYEETLVAKNPTLQKSLPDVKGFYVEILDRTGKVIQRQSLGIVISKYAGKTFERAILNDAVGRLKGSRMESFMRVRTFENVNKMTKYMLDSKKYKPLEYYELYETLKGKVVKSPEDMKNLIVIKGKGKLDILKFVKRPKYEDITKTFTIGKTTPKSINQFFESLPKGKLLGKSKMVYVGEKWIDVVGVKVKQPTPNFRTFKMEPGKIGVMRVTYEYGKGGSGFMKVPKAYVSFKRISKPFEPVEIIKKARDIIRKPIKYTGKPTTIYEELGLNYQENLPYMVGGKGMQVTDYSSVIGKRGFEETTGISPKSVPPIKTYAGTRIASGGITKLTITPLIPQMAAVGETSFLLKGVSTAGGLFRVRDTDAIRPRVSELEVNKIKTFELIKPKEVDITKIDTGNVPGEKIKVIEDVAVAEIVVPAVVTDVVQVVKPKPQPERIRIPDMTPLTPATPTTIILPPEKKEFTFISAPSTARGKGYVPFVKRYGKYQPFGRPTSRLKAVKKGVGVLRTTLGASLQVREARTGKPIEFVKVTKEFGLGKTPYTLVQRAPRRLKARTEVYEITRARKGKLKRPKRRVKFI